VQVGEVVGITRYPGDVRIYFVENPLLSRTPIGREGAGAEPYDGYAPAELGRKGAENISSRPLGGVVADRLAPLFWISVLSPVFRGAMQQDVAVVPFVVTHLSHPKKVALPEQNAAPARIDGTSAQHYAGHCQGKPNGITAEPKADHGGHSGGDKCRGQRPPIVDRQAGQNQNRAGRDNKPDLPCAVR